MAILLNITANIFGYMVTNFFVQTKPYSSTILPLKEDNFFITVIKIWLVPKYALAEKAPLIQPNALLESFACVYCWYIYIGDHCGSSNIDTAVQYYSSQSNYCY